jgi:hypothetical protein
MTTNGKNGNHQQSGNNNLASNSTNGYGNLSQTDQIRLNLLRSATTNILNRMA